MCVCVCRGGGKRYAGRGMRGGGEETVEKGVQGGIGGGGGKRLGRG